jgi:hypothetical protein
VGDLFFGDINHTGIPLVVEMGELKRSHSAPDLTHGPSGRDEVNLADAMARSFGGYGSGNYRREFVVGGTGA